MGQGHRLFSHIRRDTEFVWHIKSQALHNVTNNQQVPNYLTEFVGKSQFWKPGIKPNDQNSKYWEKHTDNYQNSQASQQSCQSWRIDTSLLTLTHNNHMTCPQMMSSVMSSMTWTPWSYQSPGGVWYSMGLAAIARYFFSQENICCEETVLRSILHINYLKACCSQYKFFKIYFDGENHSVVLINISRISETTWSPIAWGKELEVEQMQCLGLSRPVKYKTLQEKRHKRQIVCIEKPPWSGAGTAWRCRRLLWMTYVTWAALVHKLSGVFPRSSCLCLFIQSKWTHNIAVERPTLQTWYEYLMFWHTYNFKRVYFN